MENKQKKDSSWKTEIWLRIRKEGRLAAFDAKRAELREKYKREGYSREDAGDRAWREAADAFPPLPELESDGDVMTPEEVNDLLARPEFETVDLADDVLWVYGALDNRQARAKDAPTRGAWSMLKWARNHRDRFFEHLLPKALKVREAGPGGHGEVLVDRTQQELEEILQRIRDKAGKMVCPLCDGVVRFKGQKLVAVDERVPVVRHAVAKSCVASSPDTEATSQSEPQLH